MDLTSLTNVFLLRETGDLADGPRIYNLTGSSAALFFALHPEPFLAVESTEEAAGTLCKDINFFRGVLRGDAALLLQEPDGPALSGERARVIHSLSGRDSLVTSAGNLGVALWSQEEIRTNILDLRRHQEIGRDEMEQRLRWMGYRGVPLVSGKGEFSRRGWLLDVFPSTSESPLRLEFFGDEIESIKVFDVDTQRSSSEVSELLLFPAADPVSGTTLLQLMNGARLFLSDSIREREGLPPGATFFSRYSIKGPGHDAHILPVTGIGITPEERTAIGDLPGNIARLGREYRIAIISSSAGQAERVKDILREGGVIAPVIEKTDILEYEGIVSITIGELSSGFRIPGLLFLTEKEIFGGRTGYRAIRKSRVSGLLTSLDDLSPGDFVVHKDHGIGRFAGLVRQETEGLKEDLMMIEYEAGRLYLPLQGINRISKYHSEEGVTPKVDRLGGKTWQRTKERVRRKILDMAEKLVALYAERELHKGFSFSPDTELHREFDSFFPYEETPDQSKAIEEIKRDMESEKPMDRLICGDVGYGKTEVAMRAAFKAVYDGLQVAVLVPTTILCEQHYRTFRTRFSAFPIRIDYLSRFKSAKEQKETIAALSAGDIDIVIGTHGLLGKGIRFRGLGLLIIDEEHRFGVRQKERIKELKKSVDIITLTATPIPRTLSMALSDLRGLSIIETPPEERLAVRGTVSLFDGKLIKEAIEKELARNGQVFFVHNRIKEIGKIGEYLQGLLPSLRIAIAHGQMEEKELEQAMLRFYERDADILLSTAIIGSGLDVPTANTIIINRADMLGLADLYQLKGRVGRGHVRACAHLLVPGEDLVTEEAKKRLQAIQEMSYLGAGFRLALKDLEIRGAGNLLGAEQSGHIHAVGFDLYMEMLERAVAELKGQRIEEEFEPSIHLKADAFIPEEYIEDMTLRLSIYRRIASSKSRESLRTIESEMEDRFGKMPDEVRNLTDIMRLKISARELRISRIQDNHGRISLAFSPDTTVEPKHICELGKTRTGTLRFHPDGFEIDVREFSWKEVYKSISGSLDELKRASSLHV